MEVGTPEEKLYLHKHENRNLTDMGVGVTTGPNLLGQLVKCRIRTFICDHPDCDYLEIKRENG